MLRYLLGGRLVFSYHRDEWPLSSVSCCSPAQQTVQGVHNLPDLSFISSLNNWFQRHSSLVSSSSLRSNWALWTPECEGNALLIRFATECGRGIPGFPFWHREFLKDSLFDAVSFPRVNHCVSEHLHVLLSCRLRMRKVVSFYGKSKSGELSAGISPNHWAPRKGKSVRGKGVLSWCRESTGCLCHRPQVGVKRLMEMTSLG